MFNFVLLQLLVADNLGEDHSDPWFEWNKFNYDLVPFPLRLVLLHLYPFLNLETNCTKSGNTCQLLARVIDLIVAGLTKPVIHRRDIIDRTAQTLLLHHGALAVGCKARHVCGG